MCAVLYKIAIAKINKWKCLDAKRFRWD
jgi:hypothetical protein